MRKGHRWMAARLIAAGLAMGWVGCKKKKSGSEPAKGSQASRQGPASRPARPQARTAGRQAAARGAAQASTKPATLPSLAGAQEGLVKVAFGVRLGQARKSVLWPMLVAMPQVKKALGKKEYKEFVATCKVDPLTSLEDVTVVLAGDFINRKGQPKVGALVTGNFDETSAVACLKTLLGKDKKNKNFKEVTVAGKAGFSFTDDDGDTIFVFPVGKGKVALADGSLKDKMAAGPCASSPRLKMVKGAIPKDATVWVAFGKIPMKPGQLRGPLAMLRKVKAINGGYLYIAGTGAPYVLHMALDVGTGEAAQAILQTLNMVKPMIQMMTAQKPELAKAAKVVDKLATKVQGGTVYLSLPLPGDVVSGFKALATHKGS